MGWTALISAGSAVVFALAAMFTEILDGVVDADDLTVIDRPTVHWLASHRTSSLTSVQVAVTNLGGALGLAIALTVTAVAAAARVKSWRPIAFAAVTIGVGLSRIYLGCTIPAMCSAAGPWG